MKPITQNSIIATTLVVGAGIWVVTAKSLDSSGNLDYTPNVATVKGSPYGKVLAFAMQGPIDFYWHDGQTHEHIDALNDDHSHDHEHDHSHEHDHEGSVHEEERADSEVSLAWNIKAKDHIEMMSAYTHRVTNAGERSLEHVNYLKGETEDKLKFAYELDPTNYVNYGNYHLFLSAHNLGRSAADFKKTYQLSKATLTLSKQDKHDPSAWITASQAAYDILYHQGENKDLYSLEDLNHAMNELNSCLDQFSQLYQQVQASESLSPARMSEIAQQYQYISKLRDAYEISIKQLARL